MDDLFEGIGAYRWSDPDTSIEAAESIDATRLEGIVLATLAQHPAGLTSEEIADDNSIRLASITPRMAPLERKELVVRTDEKRPGASGRDRYVYKLAPPKQTAAAMKGEAKSQ